MRTKLLRGLIFLNLVTLFGFGCRKSAPLTTPAWRINQTNTSTSSSNIPVPPQRSRVNKPDTERPVAPEVPYLRQAMRNLLNANSFRAALTFPGDQGPITGTIEYNRKQGFHGTLHLTDKIISEMYLLGDQVYFRANTSTWQNVSYTPEADRIALFFQSAFPSKLDPKQPLVSDSAIILEIKDDPSGCKRYAFKEYSLGDKMDFTALCLKNNFPVIVTNFFAEGNTEVHYSDLNLPLDIGAPGRSP